jgi:Ser/Thr protein kinase RdoA (MazF antagonist)
VPDQDLLQPAAQAEAMAQLARAVLHRWDIAAADVSLLKLRENAVFRVDVPGGASYVLRIHRHQYHSDEELTSELQWLTALQSAGIEVPRNIPAVSGRLFETIRSDSIQGARQVDLLAWIEGRPMGEFWSAASDDLETLTANHRLLGELAARVHNQSAAWTLPAGFTRHAWDADGLVGDSPFWGRFWELSTLTRDQRKLLETARRRLHSDLLRLGKDAASYSMIHGDLVPENVLVNGDSLRLIDFDDAGFGWHQFEIATALISHLGKPYFERVRDTLIEGYREHRSFPDTAVEQLPLFLLARSLTYLSWAHTRAETELARHLTPSFVETGCSLADVYLSGGS